MPDEVLKWFIMWLKQRTEKIDKSVKFSRESKNMLVKIALMIGRLTFKGRGGPGGNNEILCLEKSMHVQCCA